MICDICSREFSGEKSLFHRICERENCTHYGIYQSEYLGAEKFLVRISELDLERAAREAEFEPNIIYIIDSFCDEAIRACAGWWAGILRFRDPSRRSKRPMTVEESALFANLFCQMAKEDLALAESDEPARKHKSMHCWITVGGASFEINYRATDALRYVLVIPDGGSFDEMFPTIWDGETGTRAAHVTMTISRAESQRMRVALTWAP